MAFTNLNALFSAINDKIAQAMELTRDDIYKVLKGKVDEYYAESVFSGGTSSIPAVYQRTYALSGNMKAYPVERLANGCRCKVGWEDDYLAFQYTNASGLQVLEWMDSKSHGGTVLGRHSFFTEALNNLGGKSGIINLFRRNCIAVGLPIK